MNTTGPTNEAVALHLEALKGIKDTVQRREYLAAVERNEGKFFVGFLKDEFAAWWWSEQK